MSYQLFLGVLKLTVAELIVLYAVLSPVDSAN